MNNTVNSSHLWKIKPLHSAGLLVTLHVGTRNLPAIAATSSKHTHMLPIATCVVVVTTGSGDYHIAKFVQKLISSQIHLFNFI
jgi:hypothetical protein